MSLKASKKVDTNRYELEITIDGASFQDAIQQVYRKNVKKMNVPGFRKGKAPQRIIERYYGESVFFEDALNLLYSDAIDAAAEEAGLEIVNDHIDFDLVSIDRNDGVDFKVTLTVTPEVEVGEYKGLKAERVIPAVSDEEVQAELDRMADRNARMVAVEDRPAQLEDTTVIDFEGTVDGTPFEGGKGEAYTLTLGSGQFIPGFEDQIVGHSIGEEFDVNVTFPEDYQAKDLAGKAAVFHVKLHEIKHRELPALDDEFAKDVSEFDTLDALRDDLKAKALERKTKESDDDVESQLIDQLVAGMKAEIPEAMFANRVEQSVSDFEYRLQAQGLNLDLYQTYTSTTLDDLKRDLRPQAEKQVKVRLVLEQIAKLEALTPTAEAIEAEYEKLAASFQTDVEKVKAAIPESDLTRDIVVNMAIDLVKQNAVVTDVEKKSEPAEADAAPAKKPAAKKSPAKKPAAKKAEADKAEDAAEKPKKPAAKSTAKAAPKAKAAEKSEEKTEQ